MTKKDFEALAIMFRNRKPQTFARRIQWKWIAMGVAEVCEKSNPKFDKLRFLAACGAIKKEESNG